MTRRHRLWFGSRHRQAPSSFCAFSDEKAPSPWNHAFVADALSGRNASMLVAFCIAAFWAMVVEVGLVARLIAFRCVAVLRVFVADDAIGASVSSSSPR